MAKLRRAVSAEEFDFEGIYESAHIEMAITSLDATPDAGDTDGEFAGCQGVVTRFVPRQDSSPAEPRDLEVRLPVTIRLYRAWSDNNDPAPMSLKAETCAALAISRFETSRYECRVCLVDEGEQLLQRLSSAMLTARLNGESTVPLILRRSGQLLAFDGQALLEADEDGEATDEGDEEQPRGFLADYCWRELGLEVDGEDGFLWELDRGEHEPPVASFDSVEVAYTIKL